VVRAKRRRQRGGTRLARDLKSTYDRRGSAAAGFEDGYIIGPDASRPRDERRLTVMELRLSVELAPVRRPAAVAQETGSTHQVVDVERLGASQRAGQGQDDNAEGSEGRAHLDRGRRRQDVVEESS
jgi:hypothetical protein